VGDAFEKASWDASRAAPLTRTDFEKFLREIMILVAPNVEKTIVCTETAETFASG
jgi:hypothetical protein